MRTFLLLILFTFQVAQAENNITNEVNAALKEMLSSENVEKSDVNTSVNEETLEKKRVDEAKRLAELKIAEEKQAEERKAKERVLKEKRRLEEAKKLQARVSELLERKKVN